MLTLAVTVALLLLALLIFPVTVRSIAKPLLILWWGDNLPRLFYQRQSDYCNNIIQLCSILTERYSPPLWGYVGHIQTFMFSIFGRLKDYKVNGIRHQFRIQSDGSIVSYDLFEPSGDNLKDNIMFFVIPGINNSAESDYIRAFVSFSLDRGYRVAALNHLGVLNTPLQGSRIFTYGGTGDTALMYNDLINRYGDSVQFVGIGYSLGGNILLRFLGEDKIRQNHFLCAFSFCQGYCPVTATRFWHSWTELRRFYNFAICKRMINVLKKHQKKLFNQSPQNTSNEATNNNMIHLVTTSEPAQERDSNGFATNSDKILNPDSRIWSANCMLQFDDYYYRRVMGFDSVEEMYQWSSCVPFLEKIPSLPIVFVNAIDDPLIPEDLQVFPKTYIKEHNCNAMLIQTEHGGHLGFFEGGFIYPNKITWIDRLVFEYVPVARKLRRKFS